MEKGITLRETGQAPVQKYWHELLEKVKSGEFDPTIIWTHRFRIDELKELYGACDRKENGIIKTFVTTKFPGPPSNEMPPLSSLKSATKNKCKTQM